MNDRLRKFFALFVLFMFLGSGVAFSVLSAFPKEEKPTLVFNGPLPREEEGKLISRNIVVVVEFYSPDCSDCARMESDLMELVARFSGSLVLERVDVSLYPELAEYEGIEAVPTLILKGKTIKRIEGLVSKDRLIESICSLYFNPVPACEFQ